MDSAEGASINEQSVERKYIKELENPYANLCLEVNDEVEDPFPQRFQLDQSPDHQHHSLRITAPQETKVNFTKTKTEFKDFCNPYLKLSAEGYNDDGHRLDELEVKKPAGISKDFFNSQVRQILSPYLPSPNSRRTLPDFIRDFIDQVNERDSATRAKALKLLEKYDLGRVSSGLELVFNREREDALKDKLQKIVKAL